MENEKCGLGLKKTLHQAVRQLMVFLSGFFRMCKKRKNMRRCHIIVSRIRRKGRNREKVRGGKGGREKLFVFLTLTYPRPFMSEGDGGRGRKKRS